MSNYEIFKHTINTLRASQGFYSRMAAQFESLSASEKKKLEKHLNSLPQWSDDIDCILYLEG